MVYLIHAPTGENALFVNGKMIVDGGVEDYSARLVEQIAERLAGALGVALVVQRFDPPSPDWSWEGEADRFGFASVTVCDKCGNDLHSGLCSHRACPYSRWPQTVSLEDMETLSGSSIAEKYGLVRAEVFSDDRLYEKLFFAEQWLFGANQSMLAELEDGNWGGCDAADRVVFSLAEQGCEAISTVFDYIHHHNSGCGSTERIGFGCQINAEDAHAWLRKYRYGAFSMLFAIQGMFEVLWTGDKWAWECDGETSGFVFPSREDAAVDAVRVLGLDEKYDPDFPLYRLTEQFLDKPGVIHVVGRSFLAERSGGALFERLAVGEQMNTSMINGALCVVNRIR